MVYPDPKYYSLADRLVPDQPVTTVRITNTHTTETRTFQLFIGNGPARYDHTLAKSGAPGNTADVHHIPPSAREIIDTDSKLTLTPLP